MKIIFLGTNGWYDTKTGNTLSVLIATKEYNIVLDAGTGFAKLDRYLSNSNPVFLFLSHFHLDHLIGLHTLFKFSFSQNLTISGPRGTEKVLKALLKQPFTAPLDHLSYKTEILELPVGQGQLPFQVEGLDLVHPPLSMGYRFQLEEKGSLTVRIPAIAKTRSLWPKGRIFSFQSVLSCPGSIVWSGLT